MVYITKAGDTFDSIAKNVIGDRKYTKELMGANTHYITTVIFPAGVELQLPLITESDQVVENNLPPWRSE